MESVTLEAVEQAVRDLVAFEQPDFISLNFKSGRLRLEPGPRGWLKFLKPTPSPIRSHTLRFIQQVVARLKEEGRDFELHLISKALAKIQARAANDSFTRWLVGEVGLQVALPDRDTTGDTSLGHYVYHGYSSLKGLRGHWWDEVHRMAEDWVIDGDHPWKNQKYRFVLKGIRDFAFRDFSQAYALLENLRDEDLSPMEGSLKQALQALLNPMEFKCARSQHLHFLLHLRDAVDEYLLEAPGQKSNTASCRALLKLCYARFAGVNLYQFGERLVDFLVRKGAAGELKDMEQLDFEGQCLHIDQAPMRLRVTHLPTNQGRFRGHVGVEFDPHLMGNTPYVLYRIRLADQKGQGHDCLCLRLATPTVEDQKGGARMAPEFLGLLEYYREQGKKHLAINLLNVEPHLRWENNERPRWEAQVRCAAQYSDQLYVVTLAQDSDLALNQGRRFGADILPARVYKEALKKAIVQSEHGYHFPEDCARDVNFHDRVDAIVENVHRFLFRNAGEPREVFNRFDRSLFKELVDAWIVHYLITEKVQPASFHMAGKNAVDRASKNNSVYLRFLSLLLGREDELRRVADVYAHLPALLIKQQPGNFSRRLRLIHTTRFLRSELVGEDLVSMVQNVRVGEKAWSVQDIEVDRVYYQDIYPNSESAENRREGELVDHRDELRRMLEGEDEVWAMVPEDDDDRALIGEL